MVGDAQLFLPLSRRQPRGLGPADLQLFVCPLQERFQANAEEPCSDEVPWAVWKLGHHFESFTLRRREKAVKPECLETSCNSRVAHFGVFPTNEFEGIHGYPIPSNFQPGETGLVRPHGHRSTWLGCALPLSKHDEGLGVKPKRGPWLANLKDLKIFIAKVNTQKLKGILKDHGGNSTKHQKQNTKNQETFEITSTLRLSGRVSRCHKSNSSIAPRHLCCMGWVLRVDGANWLMETEIESTNIVRLITKIDLQAILMQSIFGFHVRCARCFCRNAAALWFLNFVSIPHTGVV